MRLLAPVLEQNIVRAYMNDFNLLFFMTVILIFETLNCVILKIEIVTG
jgi:hypothetical protein